MSEEKHEELNETPQQTFLEGKKKEKRKKKFEAEKIEEKLNMRQELFCQLYATRQEFFGNGVESYAEAYDADKSNPNWYAIAAASATRLLKNEKILLRLQQIMTETGFNDAHADRELSFLMTQHADLPTKLGAIKEYNKLLQRIEDKQKGNEQITVNLVSYDAGNNPAQLPTQTISVTIPQRSRESDDGEEREA